MKDNEKLEYDVTDQSANLDDVYTTEDSKEDEKSKRRIIIAAAVVIAIILLLLGIGFGIKKNKVGAVLNDDVQEELVDGLTNYLVEIGGMDEVEAEKMARNLVKDNMGSLLVADFLSMNDDAIQQMINKSITNNNDNYYTKAEADEITNRFLADVTELRNLIRKNRDSIVSLTNEMNTEFAKTNEKVDANQKEINEKVDKNQKDINEKVDKNQEEINEKIDKNQKEMYKKVEEYRKELDTEIADINDKIDIAQLQTPLISYIWNTAINTKGTNDADDTTGDTTDNTDPFQGSKSNGISDGSSKCNWHIVKKVHDTGKMSIKEYVEVLAANDTEFTKSLNKLYDYMEEEDKALNDKLESTNKETNKKMDSYRQELYDYFNSTMDDWTKDYNERLENEKTERERDVYNLNQALNEYKDTMESWQEMVDSQLNGRKLWTGSQAEYNALGTKDPDTIYFITD